MELEGKPEVGWVLTLETEEEQEALVLMAFVVAGRCSLEFAKSSPTVMRLASLIRTHME